MFSSNQTTIIYDSGVRYVGNGLTVRVPQMVDDTTYYLYATGKTVNGIEIETKKICIVCDYLKPDVFLTFRADNIAEEGCVRLSTNYVLVEGESNTDSLIYIDDERISLLNGEEVYFNKGFSANNFYIQLVVDSIPDFARFISFDMKNVKSNITYNYGYFQDMDTKEYYLELEAYYYIGGKKKISYIQRSNRITPLSDDESLFIWIRHVDGTFDLKIEKKARGVAL